MGALGLRVWGFASGARTPLITVARPRPPKCPCPHIVYGWFFNLGLLFRSPR